MKRRCTKYRLISHTIIGNGRRLPVDRVTDQVWDDPSSELKVSNDYFIYLNSPGLEVDMIAPEDMV